MSDSSPDIGAELVAELELEGGDICFVGNGSTAAAWYRCFLPAIYMGADWIALAGEPPNVKFINGQVKGATVNPKRLDEYKVLIVQQPRGRGWLKAINQFRASGTVVLYEVDDYVHGIQAVKDHEWKAGFSKAQLKEMELCMRVCDGLICATDYLARRYRQFNPRTFVCRNGLDLGRYRLTRPAREHVAIGWAGATGHVRAIQEWINAVARVMRDRENTHFVTVGYAWADSLRGYFGERCLSIPWTWLDIYPGAMTNIDIAIAPVAPGTFHAAKSDLRWLEASALGIPVIGHPSVYREIEHGVTGFHATEERVVEELLKQLVDDPTLRLETGARAKAHVLEHRGMQHTVEDWKAAIGACLS